jgi:diguanylate cyclase (GGDEF)-like protein
MNHELLEEILSCPSLPSLPAVAVRVIEMTQNPNVKLDELASVIQNDQGLSAKILRTVNSSFYGLRQRCSTIDRALVLLGLAPVRALVLGFSLVQTIRAGKDDPFDYTAYWRRGMFTAVAARCIAEASGRKNADEAFLGGLLQDIGVMALYRALGTRYLEIMEETGGDHRKLGRAELATLELQHPDISAMLAQRWRLPDELVLPVRYHERPTAAPRECTDLVRLVGLGNIAHDIYTDQDPTPAMRRFYQKVQEWFGLDSQATDTLLKRIAEGTREMGAMFNLDTGPYPNAEDVLSKAEGQLLQIARLGDAKGRGGMEGLVINADELDPMTGVLGRLGFDSAVRSAFAAVQSRGEPLTLLEISIDGFKELCKSRGLEAGDEVLLGVATLLKKHFDPCGAAVCRIGGDIFAVVMVGTSRVEAAKVAETFREDLNAASLRWPVPGGGPVQTKTSTGMVTVEPSELANFQTPQALVVAAARAVQAARNAGGNCARAYTSQSAAA